MIPTIVTRSNILLLQHVISCDYVPTLQLQILIIIGRINHIICIIFGGFFHLLSV